MICMMMSTIRILVITCVKVVRMIRELSISLISVELGAGGIYGKETWPNAISVPIYKIKEMSFQ